MVKKIVVLLLFVLFSVSTRPALASIGAWMDGQITAAPWQEAGYTHVMIDEVRYTIMQDAKIMLVNSNNGTLTKEPVAVERMRVGDSVSVQHSGNRLYVIEINRQAAK